MFTKLMTQQYALVQPLFAPLDNFLTLASIFAGHTPGHVYVDRVAEAKTAVSFFSHRLFLAGGGCDDTAVHHNLTELIHDVVIPTTQKYGKDGIIIHPTPDWIPHLPDLVAPFAPVTAVRLYYRLDARQHAWESHLPEGYQLRPVNAELLGDRSISNLDYVREEMVSERPSVADFLEKSFGYAAIHKNEIVGWCMSEYNSGKRCELGIETAEGHRRKRLAVGMGTAVIQHALANGIHDIGWTCWEKNHPSSATAKKLGFTCVQALPVWIINF